MSNELTLSRPEAGTGECSPQLPSAWQERGNCEDFIVMMRAFRRTGGITCGDDLARRLSSSVDQPISTVARWIVNKEALAFAWNRQTMLPLFQFDSRSMAPRAGLSFILMELADVFDDWGSALWFAQPNPWLADRLPVDLVETGALPAVLEAARVDRYIARG